MRVVGWASMGLTGSFFFISSGFGYGFDGFDVSFGISLSKVTSSYSTFLTCPISELRAGASIGRIF